jgi:SAM-dependent methyltransferase
MKSDPIGSYELFAQKYADTVDTKPIHTFYERPNTWALLPRELNDLKVLDLGCGSGWYAEQVMLAGAEVTALDASQTMVEITKARLGGKGTVIVADLEKPLDFFKALEFDVVLAPLVLHYVKDWEPLFKEIARVLKNGGLFIFSTHQPHTEYQLFKLDNYYNKVVVKDYWKHIDAEVTFYHHTLHELTEGLHKAGFVIERLIEPQPLPELEASSPEMYKNIVTKPWFLFGRARKV